ncbi:hypothetical protein OCS_03149 [Ophiocordyceps sinensis CO18]|uniref:Uncharacterized protein n=1 Tax=Ophiocordyceps sinensis (strain Co18 / CGMCC 3.14243) TaxID=911162 RepID=T5AFG4_OPHSC|nr:hypothetical protein OCS_03149 [Ophiocordyceps sinensis CO18]
MARWYFPNLVRTTARSLSWLSAFAVTLILGFIAHRWPETYEDTTSGLIGAAIALLSDTWHVVSVGEEVDFPAMRLLLVTLPDCFILTFFSSSLYRLRYPTPLLNLHNLGADYYRSAAIWELLLAWCVTRRGYAWP